MSSRSGMCFCYPSDPMPAPRYYCGRRKRLLAQNGLKIVFAVSLGCILTKSAHGADASTSERRDEFSTYHLAQVPADATNGLGSWIWTDKTFDRQTCRLWKEFDIPYGTKVTSARLKMTVDDGYQFFLDGRELG